MSSRYKTAGSHEQCFKTKKLTENYLILAFFLAVAVTTSCNYLRSVPDNLTGTWKTKAPEYTGTFIELGKRSIVIGQKDGTVKTFSIKKIKKKKMNKDWNRYIIHYLDDEMQKYEFSVLYCPHYTGIIRIANKEDISWVKSGKFPSRKY